MLHELFYLFAGVVLIWKGADLLVAGGSALAPLFGVSPLVVGLTVVSFGTSAPELAVNVVAELQGSAELALGNVLGSNLANILLVLGVSAFLRELTIERRTILVEIPVATVAVVLLAILINDVDIVGRASMLDRIDGLVLLFFFGVFLYYMYLMVREGPEEAVEEPEMGAGRATVYVLGGAGGLALGAYWLVAGATWMAALFGIPENIVGLTLVAIGTSIPELATSGVAAFKGSTDIAVGNVVGSNIFNVFLVLGVTASIGPVPYAIGTNIDLVAVLVASVALLALVLVPKRNRLGRRDGLILLGMYALFLAVLGVRIA